MIPSGYLTALIGRDDSIGGMAVAALHDHDPFAVLSVLDYLEEEGVKSPFLVGKCYLICTVTLYYIGRVSASDPAWITLEDASWVHWTGRLSVLLAHKNFNHPDFGQRRPRTELCGPEGVVISASSIVSAYPWTDELPTESIQ